MAIGVEALRCEGEAALRRGDLLAAYDLARRGLDEAPGDSALHYLPVMALARMGSIREAWADYRASGLSGSDDLAHRALEGRLLKDIALCLEPPDRRGEALERASGAYSQLWERTGDYYPGINAATLALLAGDETRAAALARDVLEAPAVARPSCYFSAAPRPN
jgi:hypothetical protein